MHRLLLPLALLLGLPLGCSPPKPPSEVSPSAQTSVPFRSVRILCASSTEEAVREAARRFTLQTKISVNVVSDDSSRLATQIEHGVPADLFVTAHPKWIEHLKSRRRITDSTPLVGNRLVLISPSATDIRSISNLDELRDKSFRRVAIAGPTVPAGIYARQSLRSLGLWDHLDADHKLITSESVRAVLALVERGEVDAGIVYSTDAQISKRVSQLAMFPDDSHEPIIYTLARINRAIASGDASQESERPEALQPADSLYEYLKQPESLKVFEQMGFSPLSTQTAPVEPRLQ